ncbi:hypothetical protein IQ238_09255 [Pleurocapsales cyanobacterium LEGE 06147]|nr:hypothetical protein [Pleurocapsales cyanobacterium LEGE 06147]
MTTASETSNTLPETIFAGGGAMRALMRAHNWSPTPLGSVENWAQSGRHIL